MSEVEDRILSIQFDNASFERRMEQTLRSLDKLSESLRFADAQKGFQSVSNAANRIDLSGMASGIDHIASKFSALGAIGFTVIQRLTTSALDFARKIGGDILEPILTGGSSRAKNLEQARFLFEGIGIDVEKGMESALAAVKGTAFGLDEAAKIAAQFGAGGLKAGKEMTSALRGVAGVAALTSRSFSEIGDIFASSAALNQVNNQDLQQFATRGLNATAALAKQLGKTEVQVREMASNGEIDFKTFAKAMDDAFGEHATSANKIYSGSLANLRAAFSRLGASFIAPHLEQQRDLFNALTPVIDAVAAALMPLINAFVVFKRINTDNLIDLLNNLDIESFEKGIGNISVGFVNLYQALKPVAKAFKNAFGEIFSGSLGKGFISLTERFKDFTEGIKIGGELLQRIKSIFRGFFAGLEIGFTIVKELTKTFGTLLQELLPAGKGLLGFGDSAGDFITKLNEALVAGGGIQKFFEGIRNIIREPIKAFNELRDAIVAFFQGIDIASSGPIAALQNLRDKIFDFFNIDVAKNRISSRIEHIGSVAEKIGDIWDSFKDRFQVVFDIFDAVLDYIVDWFGSLGSKIAEAFEPGDFNAALDVVNVGLLGGIALLIRKFVNGGLKLDIGGGLVEKFGKLIDTVTAKFEALQLKLKAEALLKIAGAIALITASLVVLSLVDSAALTKALIAMSTGLGALIGSIALLGKMDLGVTVIKLNGIATAMILIAGAMLVLTASIAILSRLDLGDLAKGLIGVGGGLGILILGVRGLAGAGPGLITGAISVGIMAAALLVLSASVKIFSNMDLDELAKGLGSVAAALIIMVKGLNTITTDTAGLISAGIAIGTIASALLVLSLAIKSFSSMSFEELAKGIGAMAITLGILVFALKAITIDTAGLIAASTAMVGIAVAMNIIFKAIQNFGNMSAGELAKGLITLAAALLVMVLAVNGMTGALAGAAAMVIVAVSLHIIAGVLERLGELSVGQIVAGLLAIAGVLTVVGIAAAIFSASGVIFAVLGLGVALGVLGAAFALFGIGAALVSKAFEIMANSGAAGAKGIVEALKILITALPAIQKALVDFFIGWVKDMLKATPLLIRLFQALMEQIIETVVDLAPKIGKAVSKIITVIVDYVRKDSSRLIAAGFELLQNFLNGIRDNIGEITTTVADIVIEFLDALEQKAPEIVDSLYNLIRTIFIEVSEKLTLGAPAIFLSAGVNIIEGILRGLKQRVGQVIQFFKELPRKILDFFKRALGIDSPSKKFMEIGVDILTGLVKGLASMIGQVMQFFISLPGKILGWIGDVAKKLFPKGVQIIKGLFDGIIDKAKDLGHWLAGLPGKIVEWVPNMLGTLVDTGKDLIRGIWDGITGMGSWLKEKIKEWVLDHIPGWMQTILQISSPSKLTVEIGKKVIEGLGNGLSLGLKLWSPSREMAKYGAQATEGLIMGMRSMDREVETSALELSAMMLAGFNDVGDVSPTITPVLDLSRIRDEAGDISKLIQIPEISPGVSFAQAAHISTATAQTAEDVSAIEPTIQNFEFNQTNNSPKALSTNDIYRNTKSQFSKAKEELGIS